MQKKYTAMLRTSKLEYVAVCFELNISARKVELAAVEKNLVSAKELYWQDIVENNLPDAIISGPKINVDYVMMDTRVLCNICVRGADILSVGADILSNYPNEEYGNPERTIIFYRRIVLSGRKWHFVRVTQYLRSGYRVSSFGLLTIFVRVADPIRSGHSPYSFAVYSFFFSGI